MLCISHSCFHANSNKYSIFCTNFVKKFGPLFYKHIFDQITDWLIISGSEFNLLIILLTFISLSYKLKSLPIIEFRFSGVTHKSNFELLIKSNIQIVIWTIPQVDNISSFKENKRSTYSVCSYSVSEIFNVNKNI